MSPTIPEPREVRTLRRPGSPIGGSLIERAERQQAEMLLAANPEIMEAATAAANLLNSVMTQVAEAYLQAATNVGRLLGELLPLLPPRTRRRLRKEAKLRAHYQAKLHRIPAWKRDRG